jgi:hypothetical protein
MNTSIIVHPSFARIWPFSADRLTDLVVALTLGIAAAHRPCRLWRRTAGT